MENEQFYDEDFIINLTIEGTHFENVEVKVTDPLRTIHDQVNRIVQVFNLPYIDNGGNPVQYLLGQIINDGDEPEILEFEDEYGREQCLLDYNIQPGDFLCLINVPVAGYGCAIPYEMQREIVNKSGNNPLIRWLKSVFKKQ